MEGYDLSFDHDGSIFGHVAEVAQAMGGWTEDSVGDAVQQSGGRLELSPDGTRIRCEPKRQGVS